MGVCAGVCRGCARARNASLTASLTAGLRPRYARPTSPHSQATLWQHMATVIPDGRLAANYVLNCYKNVGECVAVLKKMPNFAAML